MKKKLEKDPSYEAFMPGKAVLLDIPRHGPKEFEKETSAKRAQVFLIHSWDLRQNPVMFKLKAINGNEIKGNCKIPFVFYYFHAIGFTLGENSVSPLITQVLLKQGLPLKP